MEQILLISGTSFLLTFLVFPVFIKFFKRRNFLDDPGGRKIHTARTPAMGGLPIFIGFCIAVLIWAPFNVLRDVKYVLSAVSIMFVIGFRDDLINLRAYQKLLGQIAAAMIIVSVCDIRFTSLYGFMGIEEIPIAVSYLISLFTIIVITNAYNLIDGIDGLSGSVGVITTLFFGIYFFLNGQTGFALITLSLCGALLAFLNYNWAPSKIFMGDTGSLFIGFFLSILTIKFIHYNHTHLGGEYIFDGSIGTAVAILILPLADTFRVFVKRVMRGKSPMHPDRTHVHHILLRLGCNHAQATGILVTVNVIFVMLALVLKDFGDIVVIPAVLVTVVALGAILDLIFRAAIEKRKEELRERNRASRDEGKVVSISKNAG
ncbi:glycosyltransferase family 4 protein [Roseivirga pacifica]|uniref:glycosyltransferase family 4 protein n=1 Tax=Roseivirga pacifica TaxID=1267423 RepID=UPI00209640FF|nr:MraY family glycosyltransferase [Roseivirga pacifica]MCO6359495.1 undecaprenyl/decaprenyl-phosphate alpha-N-acetylglucosaminyl 1-phosphate transferase [Roseivirga pacifica]MCO6366865.1 undecaprenyl/decaprenyl-phosphate alpha-N-acetylglucosaminyl 1-phosphate transferase [Roseivirga pacifica]MCO6370603.1 undecaprenyl/decaprenyl-phosphate alpha-N-acetylglucosaminyl 1-phosphate transferase [Roseivirga pacifica]MCO6379780.1 undecaprenyl/decaprenyl-phosphate alpha-N-acetylglucosaminyl 1-phosphate 